MFRKIHVFRVFPKAELLKEIKTFCEKNKITSAIVIGIIGSLNKVQLGFLKELPGKYIKKNFTGPVEIVCGQGSIALCKNELVVHIHIQISDENRSFGGHLISAEVFSTAEVVLGELTDQIIREQDPLTGLNELVV
jgi:predicted DNA-binding protein with PD1-like motif